MEWTQIERGDGINKDLPPFQEYVLLWNDEWSRPVIGYLAQIDKKGIGFQLERNQPLIGTSSLCYTVTHWKELTTPEPPIEK